MKPVMQSNASDYHVSFFCDGTNVSTEINEKTIKINGHERNFAVDFEIQVVSENKKIAKFLLKKNGVLSSYAMLTALDAFFSVFTQIHEVQLCCEKPNTFNGKGLKAYTPLSNDDTHETTLWLIDSCVYRDIFYQQTSLWLTKPNRPAFPIRFQLTDKFHHPIRPQKPVGTVYKRYIPWLKATLSFRVFSLEQDLERFSRWMNDPVVDFFWEESGDISRHKSYIEERLVETSHTLPLICCLDEKPIGYFETYWAKEDRIASYYPAGDFDRGWHVLIGEADYRGKPYVTAWMPSISHYLLLDDSRTQNVVIEPRIDNEKMKKSLGKCGYAHFKTFDFPHKTAMLGMLSREHFFRTYGLLPEQDT